MQHGREQALCLSGFVADRQIERLPFAGLSGCDAVGRLVRGKHDRRAFPTLAEEVPNVRRIGRDPYSEIGCRLNRGVCLTLQNRLVRTDDERIEVLRGVAAPLSKVLLHQRKRRDEDQRERTLQPLGDPQCCKRFARAAGHNELASIVVSKAVDRGVNRSRLVSSCIPSWQSRGCSSNLNRPLNFFRQEMTSQDEAYRLLLAVKRPAGCGSNGVRRGHEQPIGELRTVRFGDKRVNLSLGDRSVWMIRLGLNGPQLTRPRASDDVDSRVRPPTIRPILPQPDFVELTSIPGSVFQEPLAQPLEVATECSSFGITTDLSFDVLEGALDRGSFGGRHDRRLHERESEIIPLEVSSRCIVVLS